MKVIMKTAVIIACAALIGGIGAVPLVWAQQPSTTPAPQAAPAQPGPGMGQQMMQKGMDHGAAGHNMGKQMEQKGQQQGTDHGTMGHTKMQQPGNAQQPGQATPPATSKQ